MPEGYAPSLGAGLSLLNLFGLRPTAASICGAIIIIFIVALLFLRFRYPCCSPSSLMKVVEQASTTFDKCMDTRAFAQGEYDRFKSSLQRVTARATEIASRSQPTMDLVGRGLFLWTRLKDTVDCHRDTQALMHDLEVKPGFVLPT
ncbi:hypothetical protein E1B28_009262 [Marasmius oreades]|uniref:Uncharacterized protein n=1 Tax=Marasmius oreades TaxID=181124 RepID=A0A9P7UT83_9AGAR|nr:uncharacterized protein E1B28_009262 [Marasmius oreades]KAG7092960.1 hypothetical protein E1B28_009262 [Marasmius oreades]